MKLKAAAALGSPCPPAAPAVERACARQCALLTGRAWCCWSAGSIGERGKFRAPLDWRVGKT